MKFLGKICVLVGSIVLMGESSSAVIVEITDPAFPGGVNNVTRDTATGLEWLDWSVSTNISYNTMLTLFDPGDTYEGWNHASGEQTRELMNNAGFLTGSWPFQTILADGGAEAMRWFDLVGNTTPSISGAFIAAPSGATDITIAAVGLTESGDTFTSANGGGPAGSSFSFAGHALVRSFSTVPEPSAFICVGLIASGIAVQRRSRYES